MIVSKNKTRIIVTERDINLFKYLYVNKVASIKDIKFDIFDKTSLTTVARRLKKLVQENLLESQIQKESSYLLYNLSQKAFRKYLKEVDDLKHIQLKSDSPSHDLDLLQIKRKLKELSQVESFYSENLIRSGFLDDIIEVKRLKDLRSDAILKINFPKETLYLPLEYEASSKSPKRNQNLINKCYTNPFAPAVLFISKTPQIESKIKLKEEQNSIGSGQFFYIQRDDLLQSKKEIQFIDIKNNSFFIN